MESGNTVVIALDWDPKAPGSIPRQDNLIYKRLTKTFGRSVAIALNFPAQSECFRLLSITQWLWR